MPPKRHKRNQVEDEARASGQHQATRPQMNTLALPPPPAVSSQPQQANSPQGIAAQSVHGPSQPSHPSPPAPPSGHPVIPSYMLLNSPQQPMPRQAYPALQRMPHPTAGAILGNRPWITAGTQAVAQRVSPYAAQMLQYQAVQSSNRNPHTSMPPANLQPPEAGRGAQGPSSTREGYIRARLPVTRVVLPAYMPSPTPITSASGVPYDESMFRQLHENLRNIREAELVTVRIAS